MTRLYEDMAYGDAPVAANYWRTTVVDDMPWPVVEGGLRCDFAVVGGGYTGLTAALALAEAGADVLLLEAERPGWGASGRNGGFCCLGGAKLSTTQMLRRHGADEAHAYYAAEREAVEQVAETLQRLGIDADTHSHGETVLAHNAAAVATLREMAEEIRAEHGVACEYTDRAGLAAQGLASPAFHGALTTPIGFALNPMKYALGLAAQAHRAGVRIFAKSPVLEARNRGGHWHLRCAGGEIRARNLLVTTNGYSSENLPDWLAGRYLPVQSNILVTRELSADEIAAQGWNSHQMCYDTRNLLHYFRLMPNRRLLFGLRGAVRATPRAFEAVRATARADFERIFPAWRHVETPYFWSGLVAMARNLTPFVGRIEAGGNAFAALCFHGNGVAMGSYCGGLLADVALGRPARKPYPALMRQPLRRFPFGRFRRAILPAVYRWYGFRDGA